jgi:esterase
MILSSFRCRSLFLGGLGCRRPRGRIVNNNSQRRPFATLHYETISSSSKNDNNDMPDHAIVFLHGLLGNGKNLNTLAKKATWQADAAVGILIDLRGHGKSRITTTSNSTISGPHNFQACANDVRETLEKVPTATTSKISLVGHSWGGRVALQYASAQNNVQNLFLLDTVPGHADDSVQHVLDTIRILLNQSNLPGNRKELIHSLTTDYDLSPAVATWLASSYNSQEGDFGFDMDVVDGIWDDFSNQDFYGLVQTCIDQGVNVNIVRGGKNAAWSMDILRQLQAIQGVNLHVLPKAGHWVHVDDLTGLLALLKVYSK